MAPRDRGSVRIVHEYLETGVRADRAQRATAILAAEFRSRESRRHRRDGRPAVTRLKRQDGIYLRWLKKLPLHSLRLLERSGTYALRSSNKQKLMLKYDNWWCDKIIMSCKIERIMNPIIFHQRESRSAQTHSLVDQCFLSWSQFWWRDEAKSRLCVRRSWWLTEQMVGCMASERCRTCEHRTKSVLMPCASIFLTNSSILRQHSK